MEKNFLQFSDLHIDCNQSKNTLVLKKLIDIVLEHHLNSHYIIVTGDLVNQKISENYKILRDEFSRLPTPVYFIPGNEDDFPLMSKYCNDKNLYAKLGIIDAPLNFLALDTTVLNECGGYLSHNELEALDDFLSDNKRKDTYSIIAMHHPPFLTGTKWLDAIKLENYKEVRKTFDKYKATQDILVLTGHIHQEIIIKDQRLLMMSCPATSRQFTKYEEGNKRFDDYLHHFRSLSFDTKNFSIHHELVTLEL